MELFRFCLYMFAPWVPFLIRNWFPGLKVWAILATALLFLALFIVPLAFGFSFKNQALYALFFSLFLIGFSTLAFLLTNRSRFMVLAGFINLVTIVIFYFFNWKSVDPHGLGSKPEIRNYKANNSDFLDIQQVTEMSYFKTYYARKEYLGGILVKEFNLQQVSETDTCLFKGVDSDNNKALYWNKCNEQITN